MPSNFNKAAFVIGAFDNFDHNEATQSGLNSTHDTVCVLFQDCSNEVSRKPNISATFIEKRKKSFDMQLSGQTLQNFYKPKDNIVLASENSVDALVSPDIFKIISKEDFAWLLSRMCISRNSQGNATSSEQTIATRSALNSRVCDDTTNTQKVAFLPILPHPVTEFSTVYTAMCNFKDILNKLDQKYMALFCDKGVYHIARLIQLIRPDEFQNLTLMLGSFHMTKVLLSCIGKYVKESGVEHIFIETETFGINAVEQVLNGSNYARSVKGFFMLGEALQRLQLKAFLNDTNLNDYDNELTTIHALQEAFAEANFIEVKALLKTFNQESSIFLQNYENYVTKRSAESPLFKYWSNVLILIQLLRDLIRADRSSNWTLHLQTVKKLLPIFRIFDRTNYTRW